jgi:hypothetical protein
MKAITKGQGFFFCFLSVFLLFCIEGTYVSSSLIMSCIIVLLGHWCADFVLKVHDQTDCRNADINYVLYKHMACYSIVG